MVRPGLRLMLEDYGKTVGSFSIYNFQVKTRAINFALLLEIHVTYVRTFNLMRRIGFHLMELHSPFYCLN